VVFAGTLGLAAGLVFQNATYNLHRAREIHHSTVFLTLMIVVLYLRERWFERLKKSDLTAAIVIATLMLWMAVSDHIVNSAFFALAIGLLAFYRVSPPLSLRRWSSLYVLPVLAGEALFQLQLWLGRKYLGIPSLGSPLLLRLGLGDSQFSHAQILTFLRPPWSWWGLAVLATVCLVAVLIVRSLPDDDQNQRDLDPVLSPILVWIFLAAVLSELVSIHPYLYDLFLIIPSILLVFVHGPVLLTRYYAHPGLIALSVLIGATWYVWLSLSAYTRISVPF
jgi:hypothetical protein